MTRPLSRLICYLRGHRWTVKRKNWNYAQQPYCRRCEKRMNGFYIAHYEPQSFWYSMPTKPEER